MTEPNWADYSTYSTFQASLHPYTPTCPLSGQTSSQRMATTYSLMVLSSAIIVPLRLAAAYFYWNWLQDTMKILIKSQHIRYYTSIFHEYNLHINYFAQAERMQCMQQLCGRQQPAIHNATLTISMFLRAVVKESTKMFHCLV